jgi:hypothetical protein
MVLLMLPSLLESPHQSTKEGCINEACTIMSAMDSLPLGLTVLTAEVE